MTELSLLKPETISSTPWLGFIPATQVMPFLSYTTTGGERKNADTAMTGWTARVVTVVEYFKIPHKYVGCSLTNRETVPDQFRGGLLPALQVSTQGEEFLIQDSLAICEFLAESHPNLHLWPQDVKLRALARSATAQMHSGFTEMRNTYSSNFVAKYTGKIPMTSQGEKEIKKMLDLWSSSRAATQKRLSELGEPDEGFLFGKFSIADAFFWPVLWVSHMKFTLLLVKTQNWKKNLPNLCGIISITDTGLWIAV